MGVMREREVMGSHLTSAKKYSNSASLDLDIKSCSPLTQLKMVLYPQTNLVDKVSCFKRRRDRIRSKSRACVQQPGDSEQA